MRIAAMVLALMAGMIGLPAAVCSGMCASLMGAAAAQSEKQPWEDLTQQEKDGANAVGGLFMCAGLIGAVAYIAGGVLVLRKGPIGGIACTVATLLTLLTLVTFNPLSLVVLLLGGIATVLAYIKKDVAPPAAAS